jgi:DNA-binding LytR/AlgR family response regulator
MTPLKVAVADDVPLARARLARLLEEAGCEVAGEFGDGASLLDWLKGRPELDALFLDIRMPGPSGLEVAAELPFPVPVIFVTAYREHALEAFDASAVDYILKPVREERVHQALERIRQGLVRARPPGPPPGPRVVLRCGEAFVLAEVRKVSHFEVQEEEVWAWLGGRKFQTQWKSLAEVEGAFPGCPFLRLNRQVLVRPEAVTAVRPLPGGRASVRLAGMEDREQEASRSATPALKEYFGIRGDFFRG